MKNPFAILVAVAALGFICVAPARAQQQPAPGSNPPPAANAPQAPAANAQQPPVAAEQPIPANPEAAKILKTEKDKISYAIGMNVGRGMHAQSIEVNPDLILRGINDELAGGQTLLTDAEARNVIMALQKSLHDKQVAAHQVALDANKKAGDAFLAENKTKPGVVVLPDGLQYKILTEGTGPKPVLSDVVSCNYRGTLIDGKEFDSSAKRGQPGIFPVGRVVKGWTEALQLMPVGSKWQLFIPGDLAYGDNGHPPDIGPGETLIFEIELVSIQPKPAAAAPAAPAPAAPAPSAPPKPN